MKKIYAGLWIFVCLFAVPARAQDSGSAQLPKNIVFELKIVDTEARTTEAIEEIARDQNRLNQMLSEGKAKLIAGTKVYALLNEKTSMRIGQRVPIQTASLPTYQPPRLQNTTGQNSQPAAGVPQATPGIPQIQYEHTGFNLDFEPRLTRDGTINLVLRIECTVLNTDSGRLTPTFVTRTLSSVVKIKQNQPPIILEMFQNDFLAPSSASPVAANTLRGNFFILLSAKSVD
jgi:Flp pilus assembly secretin CpaC